MNDELLKENNFISAVIYVNNEAKEVNKFLKTIYSILDDNFRLFEIICVLDGKLAQKVKYDGIKKGNISVIHMGGVSSKGWKRL